MAAKFGVTLPTANVRAKYVTKLKAIYSGSCHVRFKS